MRSRQALVAPSRTTSSRRLSAAAASVAPRRAGRVRRLAARADLHGLVASTGALFPPSRQLSGASTPQRPLSAGAGGGAADPTKRHAFATMLQASLLGVAAVLAQRGAKPQAQAQQPQQQQQRATSPAFQLPPEVLEAEEEAAEGAAGWGRSHIAERLATQRVSRQFPPLDDDAEH